MSNAQKGAEFEKVCLEKLQTLGFSDLFLTPNNDNGGDIVGLFKGQKYVFQCKYHTKNQGNKCVQEVVAAKSLYMANRCAVISNSSFTRSALELAKANNCILLSSDEFFQLRDFPPERYSSIFRDVPEVPHFDYDLIEAYEEFRRKIGRTPKWDELDKRLQYQIRKKYKNYTTFLREMGDERISIKPSDDDLRKEYTRVRILLKRIPTLADMKKNSTFSANSFHAYPFTKLQRECGDRPHVERGVTKETLIDSYYALSEKLGHKPSIKELDYLGEYKSSYYRRRWGSYNAFLDSIGTTRAESGLSRSFSKTELVYIYSLLKVTIEMVKNVPEFDLTYSELDNLKLNGKRLLSPSTISKRFGGWNEFLSYLKDEELKETLQKVKKEITDKINSGQYEQITF